METATNTENHRGISDDFRKDLKTGILMPLLERVKKDSTLLLCIRKDYINIYYKGLNLLLIREIKESCPRCYSATFNTNYTQGGYDPKIPKEFMEKEIKSSADAAKWVEYFPLIKQSIDCYNATKKNATEKEFQQLVAIENGKAIKENKSGETDYFIIDLEYSALEGSAKFDMLGIKWIADKHVRKNPRKCRLVFFEIKYGSGAIETKPVKSGKSGAIKVTPGINKHISDFAKMSDAALLDLKIEAVEILRQLRDLGLVQLTDRHPEITGLKEGKPECILILANYKPEHSALLNELSSIQSDQGLDIKFAKANWMGYGLYESCMVPLERFKKELESAEALRKAPSEAAKRRQCE